MKKRIPTLLKIIGTLVLILLITAVAFPYFFRDRIDAEFKKAINEYVEGDVDYRTIRLSLFRSFPDLTVSVSDMRIEGKVSEEGQADLFNAETVSFGLDLMSLIRDQENIEVKSFQLDKPIINLYVDQSGQTNYDIIPTDSDQASGDQTSSLTVHLKNYRIRDAEIRYVDQSDDLYTYIDHLNHRGDLDYDGDQVRWKSDTQASPFTLKQKGIIYLNEANLQWDTKMDIDLNTSRYTFAQNTLTLNNLLVSLVGFVEQKAGGWNMDIVFDTDENDFKNFISLLPNMYSKDFAQVKASGLLKMNGYLKGGYDETNHTYPKYGLDFDVKDGRFQYPGKPASFTQINTTGQVANSLNNLGVNEVDISKFQFLLNNKPFEGVLRLSDLNSKPSYMAALKGSINLGDVYDAYPMETIQSLSGDLTIDAELSGSADPDQLSSTLYKGQASIRDLNMQAKDQPTLSISSAQAQLKNNYIDVSSLQGNIGESDFVGAVELKNIMTAFTEDQPMQIKADVSGKKLNLNELFQEPTVTKSNDLSPTAPNETAWMRVAEVDVTGRYDHVIYEKYAIHNVDIAGEGSMESFKLKKCTADIQNSKVSLAGQLKNMYGYTFTNDTLGGQLSFSAPQLRAEDWMEEKPSKSDAAIISKTVYTVVPERVYLQVKFNSDQVNYSDVVLKKVQGDLIIQDQTIQVKDVVGQTFGGGFKVDGLYGYDGTDDPIFNLKYDLSKLSFEQTFDGLESFRALAPIAKYLDGVYNSNMILEGKLGDDYMSNFTELIASGFFETLHGSIRDFEPIQAITQKLNINSLNEINMDYTRNWFEIKNGFLEVKPFDKTIDDIDMQISGRHKILGDMEYQLRMNVPIEKFEKLGIPSSVKGSWNKIAGKLGGHGINIPNMDQVIVDVLLSGPLSKPKVDFKIVNFQNKSTGDVAKDIGQDVVNQVKDTAATIIQNTKEIIRDTLETKVNNVKDSVTTRIEEEVDDIKEEVTDRIEDELKNKLDSSLQDSTSAVIKEVLGDDVDKEVDKIKDKLGGWNPFKK